MWTSDVNADNCILISLQPDGVHLLQPDGVHLLQPDGVHLLQPEGVHLQYFKLRLFDLTIFLLCKIEGLWKWV